MKRKIDELRNKAKLYIRAVRIYMKRRSPLYRPVKTGFSRTGVRSVNLRMSSRLINRLKKEWQEYVSTISPCPMHFKDRGIVICAGGLKYFTCAWVNIHLLRKSGCTLPVEVWYAKGELTEDVIEQLVPLNVKCKNVHDYTDQNISGFALKPFAIVHSEFKEILFLDADNNATVDPTYLFDCKEYKMYGALFWPDFWLSEKRNPIWKITDSNVYHEYEQESGQILINKEKYWRELNLCLFFNLKKYYYQMLLGDKDTFRFAWLALQSPYYMIKTPVGFAGFSDSDNKIFSNGMTMVQHDPAGNIIFMHRNVFKWDITYTDEPAWFKVKRFKPNASKKQFYFKPIYSGRRTAFYVYDIEGDVEILDFKELFGSIEEDCLQILKKLRSTDFYKDFLLHNYFLQYSPGFVQERDKKP